MSDADKDKLLVVLVGLPARGKSYVANKITAFMRWKGVQCKSFNVGALRRKAVSEKQTADFFSADNEAAKAKREEVAMQVLHGSLDWLSKGGSIAILDATNTTRARRRHVMQSVLDHYDGNIHKTPYVIFVECVCNDEAVLASNMLQKVTNSPDYRDLPVATALSDLKSRIAEYEKVYETVDETLEDADSPLGPISYIRTIDLQSKIVCRNIFGSIAFAIVSFLMVIHVGARPIYLARAGQCTDDLVRAMIKDNMAAQLAGGDGSHMYSGLESLGPSMTNSALSAGLTLNNTGKAFSQALARFIARRTAGGLPSPAHTPIREAPAWGNMNTFDVQAVSADDEALSSSATLSPLKSGVGPISASGLRLKSSSRSVTHMSLQDTMRPVKINVVENVATPKPVISDKRALAVPGGGGAKSELPSSSSQPLKSGHTGGFVVKKVRQPGDATPSGRTPLFSPSIDPLTDMPPMSLDADFTSVADDAVNDEDATEGIIASNPVVAQNDHYSPEASASAPMAAGGRELVIFDAEPAIYTSTLPRTIEMAGPMGYPSQQLSALNPMETGICLGIPLQYLSSQFPDEYARWQKAPDRARHRITGGESLMDVVARLTPFVIEMERQRKPVVIISHLSTLQVLLAYFKGVPLEDCVKLDFPMNTVVEMSPHQYGWLERRYTFSHVSCGDVVTTSAKVAW